MIVSIASFPSAMLCEHSPGWCSEACQAIYRKGAVVGRTRRPGRTMVLDM